MQENSRLPAVRLRRSVLCLPASNARAMEKALELDCDAVIYDLEDAVSPDVKDSARAALVAAFSAGRVPQGRETVIRVNGRDTDFAAADLEAVLACRPDAVLLPKVGSPQDILDLCEWLDANDAPEAMRIWAMVETPAGLLNIAAIAETGRTVAGRLDCLVLGLNDLRKETGAADLPGRPWLVPWLMQVVLAARGSGLTAIDAVFNDFRAIEAYEAECLQGRQMGYDGKMLIHPAQIAAANLHYGVDALALAEAMAIDAAFAQPDNAGAGVINLDGRMVERLHHGQARQLIARAALIQERSKTP